jgi:small nuclear ribonucleoprotein (snRNP)-like protein
MHEEKECTWIAGACYKATLVQPDDHANILLFLNVVQISAQIQEQSQHEQKQ